MKSLLIVASLLISLSYAKINPNVQANVSLNSIPESLALDLVLLGDHLVAATSNLTLSNGIVVLDTSPKLAEKYIFRFVEQCSPKFAVINSTSALVYCLGQYNNSEVTITFYEITVYENEDVNIGRTVQYKYPSYGFTFPNDHFISSNGGFYFIEGLGGNMQIDVLHRFDINKFEDEIVNDNLLALFEGYVIDVDSTDYVAFCVLSDESAIVFEAANIFLKYTFKDNKTEVAQTTWDNEAGYIFALRLEDENVGVVFYDTYNAQSAEFWNFDTMERVGSPVNLGNSQYLSADQVMKGQFFVSTVLSTYIDGGQTTTISQVSYTVASGFQEWSQLNSTSANAFGAIALTEQDIFVVDDIIPSSILQYQYSTDV